MKRLDLKKQPGTERPERQGISRPLKRVVAVLLPSQSRMPCWIGWLERLCKLAASAIPLPFASFLPTEVCAPPLERKQSAPALPGSSGFPGVPSELDWDSTMQSHHRSPVRSHRSIGGSEPVQAAFWPDSSSCIYPCAQVERSSECAVAQEFTTAESSAPAIEAQEGQTETVEGRSAADIAKHRQQVAAGYRWVAGWYHDDDTGSPRPLPGRSPRLAYRLFDTKTGKMSFGNRLAKRRKWLEDSDKVGRQCGSIFETVPNYGCKPYLHTWRTKALGCGKRPCPTCVVWIRRRTVKVAERIIGTFKNPRFATLTLRSQHDLWAMIEDALRGWEKLRHRVAWTNYVKGCVWCLEVTWNKKHGWHVHFHIVWDGEFIPRRELLAVWSSCTDGEGQGVHLEQCHGSPKQAARELAKYIGKDLGWGKGFSAEPEHLAEFIACTAGLKAFRRYGTALKIPDEKEAPEQSCPECKLLNLSSTVEYIGHCREYYAEQYQDEWRRKSAWRLEPGQGRSLEGCPETSVAEPGVEYG